MSGVDEAGVEDAALAGPDKQERATRTVLEQAEALSADWAMA